MADTFVSAIIFRAAPKARNRQKQCSMIFLPCEICFAQEMRACARVTRRFQRSAVSASPRDRSKYSDVGSVSLRDRLKHSDYEIGRFFIKPTSFVSLRGGRNLCAVSLRIVFQTFRSGNCSVSPQNLSVLSLRGGRIFAPDAAILNEAIFIMFLPHLGACFALLPCRSSVFFKKMMFLEKNA